MVENNNSLPVWKVLCLFLVSVLCPCTGTAILVV